MYKNVESSTVWIKGTIGTHDNINRNIIMDDKKQIAERKVQFDTIYIKQSSANGPNLACPGCFCK